MQSRHTEKPRQLVRGKGLNGASLATSCGMSAGFRPSSFCVESPPLHSPSWRQLPLTVVIVIAHSGTCSQQRRLHTQPPMDWLWTRSTLPRSPAYSHSPIPIPIPIPIPFPFPFTFSSSLLIASYISSYISSFFTHRSW